MQEIEDFMNRLTDMDWGWWPVVSMRPPQNRDIDDKVILKISPIFGSPLGLLLFVIFRSGKSAPVAACVFLVAMIVGCAVFFVTYKSTFAHFWNRRAKRLRSADASN